MITKYQVIETWEGGVPRYAIGAHCIDGGFFLPKEFPFTPFGKIEAEQLVFNLTEWYGLPVEEETIMNYFNQEILK